MNSSAPAPPPATGAADQGDRNAAAEDDGNDIIIASPGADLIDGRGGPPIAPYDNAGYTLAFQMGVRFDRVLESAFHDLDSCSNDPLWRQ